MIPIRDSKDGVNLFKGYSGAEYISGEFVTDQIVRDQKDLKKSKKLVRRAMKIFCGHLDLYPTEVKWLKDAQRFLK